MELFQALLAVLDLEKRFALTSGTNLSRENVDSGLLSTGTV